MYKLLAALLVLPFCPVEVFCQSAFVLDGTKSEITISGTSSLHDWTSDAEIIEGSVQISSKDGSISSLENLKISVPVNSIKSGKNAMDKNTYKAMKESQFNQVVFHLNSIKTSAASVTYTGEMKIAGVSKVITGDSTYSQVGSSGFTFKGAFDILMTDYGIEPPTAMLGSIKTGDKITINYVLEFKQN